MPEIVIVGGGIAGLTAAYYLAKQERNGERPFRVKLLEAEPETGGQARAFSIGPKGKELTVEHGSHVFFNYYQTITGLIEELRRDPDLAADMPGLSDVHGWTIVNEKGRAATLRQVSYLPTPYSVIPSTLQIPWLSLTERLRLLWGTFLLLATPFSDFNELDNKSSEELGEAVGYGPGGIRAWNSASLGLTNLFVKEQSGTVFCAKHKVLIGYPNGLDYKLPAGSLTKIFAAPMTKRLESLGVEVIVGAKVESMGRARGAARTHVKYLVGEKKHTLEADHVILAVKPEDAAELVTWVKAPWRELKRVTPVITLVLVLSGKIVEFETAREFGCSREDFAFSVLTDLTLFWPELKAQRDAGHTVIRCEIGHADLLEHGAETSKDELVELVMKDLVRLFPDAKGLEVVQAEMHVETKHLYTAWQKGSWQKKPQKEDDRDVGQGIFLAGDWTTKGTIGMEAAANSGIEAANWVLKKHRLPEIYFRDIPLD